MKTYTFNTTYTPLKKYNGTKVELIKTLIDDEVDILHVDKMYKVRFHDGYERDVFEYELSK